MANLGRTNDHWIYIGAFPATFWLVKRLRKEMTKSERVMWGELRNRFKSRYKFRRQHPIREFVVDFFCPEKGLIIEIDGKIHQKKSVQQRDENRTAELERMGLTIIRFTNDEIMTNLENVMQKLETALTNSPSPFGEGAGG